MVEIGSPAGSRSSPVHQAASDARRPSRSKAGVDIVLADIDEDGLGETTRLIEDTGRSALAVRTDVTSGKEVASSTFQTDSWLF